MNRSLPPHTAYQQLLHTLLHQILSPCVQTGHVPSDVMLVKSAKLSTPDNERASLLPVACVYMQILSKLLHVNTVPILHWPA